MRSGQRSGKSSSAIRETDSAICARIAFSFEAERAIIAGTSRGLRASLSESEIGYSSLERVRTTHREKRISNITYILQPSEFHSIFEVYASCQADGVIISTAQDELEKVDNKGRLTTVRLKGSLCLLSGLRIQRI